jgi:Zn-dependent protease with chaperone function
MSGRLSLAQRAALAVALMAGFYLLALSLAVGLVALPIVEYWVTGRLHWLQLDIACLSAAGAILVAVWPRRDVFIPPGPELTERAAPNLFAVLRGVASATRQEMPEHVYLDPHVNAAVTHRGGVMGFGSRRVIILGLPLIQGLSVDQLRAVVAHEFGHYQSGDVSLGPWIYKTRAAIGRAIARLGDGVLARLFILYGNLFLRITLAISRQQELVADEVSAAVTSAETAARTLTRVERLEIASSSYWQSELVPVLEAGFVPPLASGFDAFLEAGEVRTFLAQPVTFDEDETEKPSMSSHPPRRERLAALAALPAAHGAVPDERSASLLLEGRDALAMEMLRTRAGAEAVGRLAPILWRDVGDAIHIPSWLAMRKQHAVWLATLTADAAPVDRHALLAMSGVLAQGDEDERTIVDRALYVWAAGVALCLVEAGWRLDTGPGRPIMLVRGEERINPFQIARTTLAGDRCASEWRTRCDAIGLTGRPLCPSSNSVTDRHT